MTEEPTSGAAEALPTIEFAAPLPGFPEHRRFLLVRVDEDGMLYSLASVEDPGLRFMVMPPGRFFPDYAPEVDDETAELLAAQDPADVLTLLVVTAAGDSAGDATANLMAPVLVDQVSRRAVQAVLTGSGLPVRASLKG